MDSNSSYDSQNIGDENAADENVGENEHNFDSGSEAKRKSMRRHITGYSLFLRHRMVKFIFLLRMF